jgi:hypothetical protein
MTYRNLMEWIESEPFVPFRINLTDGRSIDIPYPTLIWPGRRTVMVGFPDNPEEPDVPERHQTISLMHIVSIEPLSLAQKP